LTTGYDDGPVAALTAALRIVAERPDADWGTLVGCIESDIAASELIVGNLSALDRLLMLLVEQRTLPCHPATDDGAPPPSGTVPH
jgi:hypothetical protein